MSVDDWAQREAEGLYLGGEHSEVFRIGHADGIVHAFDALLSDEAVYAMKRLLPATFGMDEARAALQVAVRAATESAE